MSPNRKGSRGFDHQQEPTTIRDQPLGSALFGSPIGLAVTDTEGHFLLVNESFCRTTGYTEEELLNRDWTSLIHPDHQHANADVIHRMQSDDPSQFVFERRYITKNGFDLWLRSNISPLHKRGAPPLFIALVEDITERKHAERALATSEEKFIKALNAAPVGISLVSVEEGRQIEANEALLKMTGYTRGEVIGRVYSELAYWQDPLDRQRIVERLLAGEGLRNVECRFCRKSGEPFTGLLSAELIEVGGEQCAIAAVMDITQLRRTEEVLRSTQDRAALYLKQTMFAVIEWDSECRVVEWNPAAESIFGYERAEVLGCHAYELIVPPDIVPEVDVLFEALMRHSGGQLSTNVNVTKSGERIVCEWFNTPLVAENGDVIGIMSLARDITAQKKAQLQLTKSQTILSALFESTEDMIWIVDPERFGLAMFNPGLARYFARDRDIQIRVGMTPDDLLPNPGSSEMWKSFYRRALKDGSFRLEYEVSAGTHILDLSFYPLVRDGRVFGISVFGRDVTASRRTERALKESEDRYRHLVESSNDWVWEVDTATRYTYVGPQCREVLGYEPEEILGKTPFDFMPEPEARRVAGAFGELAHERKPFRRLENTNLHKSGRLVVLETNGAPVFDIKGYFKGYRGMDRDITERKLAEIALRENEQRYRTLTDNVPAALFQFYAREDTSWGFYFVHENSRNLLGIEVEPLQTWSERVAACLDPEDVRRGVASIKQAIACVGTWDFETKFKKPTGEDIYIRGVSKPQRHGSELVFYGILLDITPRKRAEQALRESEERLRLAVQASRMYAFEWKRATDVVMRSAECADILGVAPDAIHISGKEFFARMHPADREQYTRAVESLSPGQPSFRLNYRFYRSDGVTVWLEDHVRAVFDDRGSLLRTIGMTADITARKEVECALNELSGRLINAQEEERKRLARELHDGVSQELAIISIEMAQAAKATTDKEIKAKLEKLCEKVQDVLSGIGHLSHELHPSTLKHLGLSAAIRVLCEEVEQTYDIDIEFTDRNSPQAPSKDTALCLYRVAQESLRNIVKHSRSKQAWVELDGDESEISLHIWDCGVGFDTRSAKAGLGLVSMRERLRLVGGRIVISSRPNFGTRIEAYGPIDGHAYKAA